MNKILVVEDEAPLRTAIHDTLVNEKFDVIEATNGEEGLRSALDTHPDLILLDVIMPVMDGMTMLKKLRESGEWGKHIPVIVLTNVGSDNNKMINDVTVLEPSYYFVKSDWRLEGLVIKIKELLMLA
jgi:DNA-binding response OmpR family regulator